MWVPGGGRVGEWNCFTSENDMDFDTHVILS